MAHAFQTIPAKPAFGTLKENLYQSDYINRKKGKYIYCTSPSFCNKINNGNSYEKRYLYNLGRYSRSLEKCNVLPVNKSNLIVGQYTKLNLKNVCTVSAGPPSIEPCTILSCDPCQNNDPVLIDVATTADPFYWNNTIDPLGQLFGASQCGELNYTHYMEVNLPSNSLPLGLN